MTNPQDNVARQVREQLGAMMIELLVLKTELEVKDAKIKEQAAELEKLRPAKKKVAAKSQEPESKPTSTPAS